MGADADGEDKNVFVVEGVVLERSITYIFESAYWGGKDSCLSREVAAVVRCGFRLSDCLKTGLPND